ncbi:hypothetical protein MRX96_030164 [Rhipicephalus microplus]
MTAAAGSTVGCSAWPPVIQTVLEGNCVWLPWALSHASPFVRSRSSVKAVAISSAASTSRTGIANTAYEDSDDVHEMRDVSLHNFRKQRQHRSAPTRRSSFTVATSRDVNINLQSAAMW